MFKCECVNNSTIEFIILLCSVFVILISIRIRCNKGDGMKCRNMIRDNIFINLLFCNFFTIQ